VHFVTFNYDTSLECRIFQALNEIYVIRGPRVSEFIANNRVAHVYGSLSDMDHLVMLPKGHSVKNLMTQFLFFKGCQTQKISFCRLEEILKETLRDMQI